MGNHPSAHQPLERGTGQRNGLRLSKRERSTGKRMDRLRRSFRDSFRRRKDPHVPESSKPHQWQADESAVRSATCAFHVKYLGCVEVFESRGMQVCEEALKVLRNSKRKPVRAILYVSGDGLRVVEDETKGLIVDQTIEKVSFCAPDRNHDKGFSYICRDGTTRRWMCHGFMALKEPGDRLSHAVGCAFSTCLERKQKRDQECGVTMTFDNTTSTFTRSGSFRQPSLTERLQQQESKERAVDVPPVRQVYNPFAIERPHATPHMLERQGSFRGFTQLNQASPFKRQLSLRINDLPSNLERTRSLSLEPSDLSRLPLSHIVPLKPVSPIPEMTPSGQDSVSAMCQQLSQGLSLLSSNDYFGPIVTQTSTSTVVKELHTSITTTTTALPVTNSTSLDDIKLHNGPSILNNNNINNSDTEKLKNNSNSISSWRETLPSNPRLTPILNRSCNLSPVLSKLNNSNSVAISTPVPATSSAVFGTSVTGSPAFSTASTSSLTSSNATNSVLNRSPIPITPITCSPNASVSSVSPVMLNASMEVQNINSCAHADQPTGAAVEPVPASNNLPKPEQWLGTVTSSVPVSEPSDTVPAILPAPQSVRRGPPLHSRALSLGSASMSSPSRGGTNDPFDAEWAEVAAKNLRQAAAASTTNPFIMPNATQAFQVQL